MNINSSEKSSCLFSKLTKGSEQCKRLEFDLNLPASSNETESTQNINNSDDEALSRYAGTDIRRSEYEYQQLNGRPHNDNSFSDTMDSSQKDASRKKKNSSNSNIKWKQQVKVRPELGLEVPPNDGYMWRKYGQKEILNAKYPREYYRCTYRNTNGCGATKQVQRSSQDPSIFDITYLGKHTCPKISKMNDPLSATESGYGLINFSSTPESASNSSRNSDVSSAITRNSFELSNWPLHYN